MKLYHYTAITLGESILSGAITDGHLMHSDGSMSRSVVWLTSDPKPAGHGLTLGTEAMDAAEIAHQERLAGGPIRNNRTLDKTQLRISVEMDPDAHPGLMSFMAYCNIYESKAFAKAYGLSCLVDIKRLPDKELKRLARIASTKENTWWLSFQPVRSDAFLSVDFNVRGKFTPYDFEAHGREAMRRCGFAFPSIATLAEIADLVPPAHGFESPKAFVFCEDPKRPPKVAVRGGGSVRGFAIRSHQLAVGEADDKTRSLQTWVERHEEELMTCWQEAVELYYEAYPDRREATPT